MMPLNDIQIQNIVFNETRSLSGPQIAAARENIAHAVINGDENPPRPITGPVTVGAVPAAEAGTYNDCVLAVAAARASRKGGADPTSGARHFNFRRSNSILPFQGHAIKTQTGPFENSYPTADLPASQIYGNTYE